MCLTVLENCKLKILWIKQEARLECSQVSAHNPEPLATECFLSQADVPNLPTKCLTDLRSKKEVEP